MSDHYPIELLIHSSHQTSDSKRETSPSHKTLDSYITSASFKTSGSMSKTSEMLGSDVTSASFSTSDSRRRRFHLETTPLYDLIDRYLTSKSYERADSTREATTSTEISSSRHMQVRIEMYLTNFTVEQFELLSFSTQVDSSFTATSLWQYKIDLVI